MNGELISGAGVAKGTNVQPTFGKLIALAVSGLLFAASTASAQLTPLEPIQGASTESAPACPEATGDRDSIELSVAQPVTGACTTRWDEDNIVWGTVWDDADNIVWGTMWEGDDNIVWGTIWDDADNIVWGTAWDGADNIVWGTSNDVAF